MNFGAFVRPLLTIRQNFTQKKLEQKGKREKEAETGSRKWGSKESSSGACCLFIQREDEEEKLLVLSIKTSRERK